MEEDEATKKLAPWGKFIDLREIGPLIGGIEGLNPGLCKGNDILA